MPKKKKNGKRVVPKKKSTLIEAEEVKKKKEPWFSFDEDARKEVEEAKKWFGFSTDEEALSRALWLLFLCRVVEQEDGEICARDANGKVNIVDLHKEEKEVEIEVELEEGDEKDKLKN